MRGFFFFKYAGASTCESVPFAPEYAKSLLTDLVHSAQPRLPTLLYLSRAFLPAVR